ncbi:hypothetical protein G6F31_013837 [Rhizopus arrhizus]|nr:hypothetical protein G6F31_013837 [Rhizopus arrhizus]
MSAFYARMQATAERLIARFGYATQLERDGAPTGPPHNPQPGPPTRHDCTVVDLDYSLTDRDTTLVQQGDKLGLISTAIDIKLGKDDRLLLGDQLSTPDANGRLHTPRAGTAGPAPRAGHAPRVRAGHRRRAIAGAAGPAGEPPAGRAGGRCAGGAGLRRRTLLAAGRASAPGVCHRRGGRYEGAAHAVAAAAVTRALQPGQRHTAAAVRVRHAQPRRGELATDELLATDHRRGGGSATVGAPAPGARHGHRHQPAPDGAGAGRQSGRDRPPQWRYRRPHRAAGAVRGQRPAAAGERRSGADGGVLRPQAARQAPGRDRQPGHQGRPAGGAGRRREDRRALCGPAAGAAWRDDRAHRVADGHGRR